MRVSMLVIECSYKNVNCITLKAGAEEVHVLKGLHSDLWECFKKIVDRAAKQSRKPKAEAPPAQEAHEEIGGSD